MLSFSKKIARKLLRAPATALVVGAAAVTARQLVAPETAQTLFGSRGYHLLRDSYYLPIPEASDVGGDFWESQSELVGLVIDHEAALRLVEDDLAPFISEFRASFPLHATADASSFDLLNGMFMAVDASVY